MFSSCCATRGLTSMSFCIMSSWWRERTSLCLAFSWARSLSMLQFTPVAYGAILICQIRSKRVIQTLTQQHNSRCMRRHLWRSWRLCLLQPQRADAASAPDYSRSNSRGSAATNTNKKCSKFTITCCCIKVSKMRMWALPWGVCRTLVQLTPTLSELGGPHIGSN